MTETPSPPPSNIPEVFKKYGEISLEIRADGPPTYTENRVVIEGSSRAFRMLAEVLISMANTVDTHESASQHGWGLVLSGADIPQLKLGDALLTLYCDPAWGPSI